MLRDVIPATGDYWLRDARVSIGFLDAPDAAEADREGLVRRDLRIEGGRIAAVEPAGTAPEEGAVPMRGGQVWPGFVDGHKHLDKGHIWPRMPNATGDFAGAMNAVMSDRGAKWSAEDIRARFEFGLRCAEHHGTVAVRTHLETYNPENPTSWRVFRALRDEWAGRIEIQASSIAPLDRFLGESGEAIADLVAESGGVLGMVTRLQGGVHDELPADFQPMLDRFFSLAEARGLELDLHVDESGETGARALREIARTIVRRGFRRPVQCGHCCSLSIMPEAYQHETIAACADAGLSVIVLPMCNMYLQDRAPGRTPRWRGVTLVHELRAAGVRVSVASDNCRDPFYAYGDHDMLEVFRESARILQLDHPFADWPAAAARFPAEAMGLPERGRIAPGLPADLVLFGARGMTELLSRPQSDRVVLRRGRVVRTALPDWRELDAVLGV
ncbi:cytosine deaminase [Roseomonas sp. OT10]|uniref:cytosine deaminase n=1 Tax=Roseomonas cutis TaxID=2897332 RepID=UPI001E3CB704|nr:cytosine deaminase [Roseomonas sp. OT10]UFN51118.1 cytosine deaminase [Roseomonas sp. OT10]